MKRTYSTKPNLDTSYDPMTITVLNSMQLAWFKSIADQNALQFDICVKTDGIRITVIKKNEDKTVRKRTVECDNNELSSLFVKLQQAVQEILIMSAARQPGLFI